MLFKGSAVALVTPFTSENTVNYNKLEELVEFHIKNGTDAIVVCGTTGEASTLSDREHIAAIKCVIDAVNKRIPVIAGTGGNDTEHSVLLSKIAENFGADGLLIINPYYNKGNKSGIKAHFTKIAQSVDTPIIIYNVPSRTGVNLSPNLIAELSYNEPNIVAVKEASGDLTQVAEIARLVDDDFAIYSGNDDSTLPLLSLGGVGVISVLANICPKESHDLVYSFLDGNIGLSRKLQLDLKPLIDALFLEVNPGGAVLRKTTGPETLRKYEYGRKNNMRFFIDTAKVEDIKKANDMGVICGVTTNPSLIAKEGRDFKEVIKEITEIVDGPISGEVKATTTDAEGMIKEGREIAAIHPNMVVKIPMTVEGLKAVKVLSAEGIKTNVTLIFSANQALLAARAGATYVSPFLGRLDDISTRGVDLIREIVEIFDVAGIDTEIIAASVRNPIHVTDCALAGADIATVPYNVIVQMTKHPLTDAGIAKFQADYKAVFGE